MSKSLHLEAGDPCLSPPCLPPGHYHSQRCGLLSVWRLPLFSAQDPADRVPGFLPPGLCPAFSAHISLTGCLNIKNCFCACCGPRGPRTEALLTCRAGHSGNLSLGQHPHSLELRVRHEPLPGRPRPLSGGQGEMAGECVGFFASRERRRLSLGMCWDL